MFNPEMAKFVSENFDFTLVFTEEQVKAFTNNVVKNGGTADFADKCVKRLIRLGEREVLCLFVVERIRLAISTERFATALIQRAEAVGDQAKFLSKLDAHLDKLFMG